VKKYCGGSLRGPRAGSLAPGEVDQTRSRTLPTSPVLLRTPEENRSHSEANTRTCRMCEKPFKWLATRKTACCSSASELDLPNGSGPACPKAPLGKEADTHHVPQPDLNDPLCMPRPCHLGILSTHAAARRQRTVELKLYDVADASVETLMVRQAKEERPAHPDRQRALQWITVYSKRRGPLACCVTANDQTLFLFPTSALALET